MKTKIITATIGLFSLIIMQVNAQNITYDIFAGPDLRSLSYGNKALIKDPDIGLNLGADIEFASSANFSILTGLDYEAQGSKNGPFNLAHNYRVEQYDNDVKFGELNYLMVPVLAKFSRKINEHSPFHIYFSAGPYVAYLLSADEVLISNERKVFGTAKDVRSLVNDINAGIDANAGLSYFFSTGSLSVQAGGNYGFLKLERQTQYGNNYAGALSLCICYSFWLSNNFLNNGHFQPER